jgi:hypothetical protein
MSSWLNAAAVTTAALLATAAPAEAQLLGVQVEGSYIQNANPGLNLFTTLNTNPGGSMPVGIQTGTSGVAGNSVVFEGGPIVTVKDTVLFSFESDAKGPPPLYSYNYIEFVYSGGSAQSVSLMYVGVDFNDNGFTFATQYPPDADQTPLEPFTLAFTSQTPGAFNGLTLISEENFNANLAWSLVGDTITITPKNLVPDAFLTATFAFAPQQEPTNTPEPASLALIATALLGLGLHRYRRRAACPTARAATS